MEEPTVVTLVGRVTVYTVTGCLHCIRTKTRLVELGLPYSEVDLRKHRHLREKIRELTGRSTVPQIFFNNVHVGGNSEFQKMSKEELDRLIELVKNEELPPNAPPLPDMTEEEDDTRDAELKCERDEYADIVVEFKQAGIIGTNRSGLKVHKHTFSGRQLVKWMNNNKGFDEGKAVDVGKKLVSKKFINPLHGKPEFEDSDALYKLVEHDKAAALNIGTTAECYSVPATEHSEAMRELVLNLYAEYISPDGKRVDYKAMAKSTMFQSYCQLAIQLQRVEVDNLTRKEKLAFFINVYNALVIHAQIIYGQPKNVWQRYRFFNIASYVIGGEIFLQSIENGVLRANQRGIAQIMKPFSSSDPQLKIALMEPEPLIHFALNCGARSCPAIQIFNAKDVDALLITAAEGFLEGDDGCSVNLGKREIRLSQIFKWYKVDFGGTDRKVAAWVYNHMADGIKKRDMKKLLDSSSYKLSYLPYDWRSNAK
uniref:Zgc:152951 n=1 Tax=Callorhinchus milii TaxID=7868 RepID=A0A4W3JU43_CALMI